MQALVTEMPEEPLGSTARNETNLSVFLGRSLYNKGRGQEGLFKEALRCRDFILRAFPLAGSLF